MAERTERNEQLSLVSLGVDLDALARRIGMAQERADLSDDACAIIAGVSEERFRAWKAGTERPGVARMPKLAEAVRAPVSWLMFDTDAAKVVIGTEFDAAMSRARRASALSSEIVPMVEALARAANEISQDDLPVVGGKAMARSLTETADTLADADAIPSSHVIETE